MVSCIFFNVRPLECVVTFLRPWCLSNVVKVARWSTVWSSMFNGRWYSGCNRLTSVSSLVSKSPSLQFSKNSDLADDLQYCPWILPQLLVCFLWNQWSSYVYLPCALILSMNMKSMVLVTLNYIHVVLYNSIISPSFQEKEMMLGMMLWQCWDLSNPEAYNLIQSNLPDYEFLTFILYIYR